jgi:phosphopantetheinyl transferase
MNKKENITIECLNLQKGIADNNCKLTKNKKITIFYFSPENFYCKTRLFAKTLSSDEKVKAASFHFVKDSKNYIINRGILRFLLCEKTGGNSAGVQINMGINNKPFVDNTDIFFNVSHTKTLCVIALSDNCNLGVDIEMIRKNVGYKKISNSFFSDSDN